MLTMRSQPDGSDAALMRAFASRDERAADTLYDRFSSRIYGLGMVMLGGDAAAQDLVQDTFVKLWRNAERYDTSRGKLETWVLLVARSLAIDSTCAGCLRFARWRRPGSRAKTTPRRDRRSWPKPATLPTGLARRCSRCHRSNARRWSSPYFGGRTSF